MTISYWKSPLKSKFLIPKGPNRISYWKISTKIRPFSRARGCHVCVCVHTYACARVCVCTYAYTRVCVHVRMCVYTYLVFCARAYNFIRIARMYVCMYAFVCVQLASLSAIHSLRVRARAHTHKCVYIHIHIRTEGCIWPFVCVQLASLSAIHSLRVRARAHTHKCVYLLITCALPHVCAVGFAVCNTRDTFTCIHTRVYIHKSIYLKKSCALWLLVKIVHVQEARVRMHSHERDLVPAHAQ